MNTTFAAVVNGFVFSVPLAAAVWLALRVTRNILNSATRHGIWWCALIIVAAQTFFHLPTIPHFTPQSRPMAASVSPRNVPSAIPSEPIVLRHFSPSALPLRVPESRWPQRLAGLWAVAAILMLARLGLSLAMLNRQRTNSTDAPASLALLMRQCLNRCSVQRSARIAIIRKGASPHGRGAVFAPTILIPARLLWTLDDTEMEQICLHEAAHLARYDDLALLLQRCIEALFVIHPVVRWISRQIDLECEIACDDYVIAATGQARAYASCLTHVAELANGYAGSHVAPAAANESSHLSKRIEMLLNKSRRAGIGLSKARFTTALVAMVLGAWIVGQTPALLAIAAAPVALSKPAFHPVPPAAPLASALPVRFAQVKPLRQASPPLRMVRIPVTVTDSLNRFVTGLDSSVFKVYEDGAEQEIASLDDDAHYSLDVVSSRSENVKSIAREIAAQEELLAQLRTLYNRNYPDLVDHEARLLTLKAEQALAAVPLGGRPPSDSSLLTGLHAAIAAARAKPAAKRAIVIVFDAHDQSIAWPESELHALVREAQNIPIYSIAVNISSDQHAEPPPLQGLLAEATGGRPFKVNSWAAVAEINRKIGIELANQYILAYTSTRSATDSPYRKVEVRLVPPRGLPELTAYSVPGYYPTTTP